MCAFFRDFSLFLSTRVSLFDVDLGLHVSVFLCILHSQCQYKCN